MIRPERLKLPKWIISGIRANHRGFPDRYKIWGGDTETVHGEPYSLQLTDGADVDFYYVDKKNIMHTFCAWLDKHAYQKHPIVLWFHNLEYDLTTIFYDHLELFQQEEINVRFYGWTFKLLYGKKIFGEVRKGDYHIRLLDTADFFRGSLKKIAKILNCEHEKLPSPEGLGERRLRTKYFRAYAKRDAVVAREIGEKIIGLHKEWGIRLTVSIAQMASTIFRHCFVRKGERIPFPSMDCVRLSRLAYHGGKNGFYAAPGIYEECSEIDIVSAYPYAMRSLPNFASGRYRFVEEYIPDRAGIYMVRGHYPACRYVAFMTHEGRTIDTPADVDGLAVTSYELEEALRDGFRLDQAVGYVWEPGPPARNPIEEYIDYFFAQKNRTSKKNPKYLFFKLMLNSMYGKFIQEIKHEKESLIGLNAQGEVVEIHTRDDLRLLPKYENISEEKLDRVARKLEIPEETHRTAGGLYNPFIAALITGFTRAHIHRLEHRYNSLHTSTDSVKTLRPPEKIKEDDTLGGHKIEITGRCVLVRNKLYLHYDGRGRLKKYALHGFHGSAKDLERLIRAREKTYTYEKVNKVRESLIQGLRSGAFERRTARLNYDGIIFDE